MRRILHCILSAAFCIQCTSVTAQVVSTAGSQKQALQSSLTQFYNSLGKQSPLYNGTRYFFYESKYTTGNAYYADLREFTPGDIFYDGLRFNGVPMLYDLYKDGVVILLYNHFTKLQLVKSKVAWFEYHGHHFVNINADTIHANTVFKSGFYDLLYDGKIQVLARRLKTIQVPSSNNAGATSRYFESENEYYIKKGDNYYEVHNKHSFIDVLKDKKKQLNQFIRSAQIDFNSDREAAMIQIASHYDQITH